MPFPAGLTLVTVNIRFDTSPDGGASGMVSFVAPAPLRGGVDNSIVVTVKQAVTLAADGTASIQLPATNDPDWVPQDWAYSVTAALSGATIRGTLQLDYQTAEAELADLLQVDGAATPGTTYATLAQLAAHTAATDPHGDRAYAAALVDDLSGVTSAATARDNLGLGDAATLDVGATAGTVAAGDDARIAGALQTTGGTVTGDIAVNGGILRIENTPGTFRQLQYGSGTAEADTRWSIHVNNTAESGGNAGSNWRLVRYSDAGEALDAPIGVDRATGAVALGGALTVTGPVTLGAKNALGSILVAGRRTTAGPPTAGTWLLGDVVQSVDGFWQCTVAGTPGTWLQIAAAEGASRIVDAGEYVIPRRDIITESPATTGNLYMTHFTASRTETIQTIRTGIGGTVATSADHAWLGIASWDGTNYTPVAASVDDPTRWTSGFQLYDTQIFAWDHPGEAGFEGWSKIAGQSYAFWVLWIGAGTAPSLPAGGGWYADALESPRVNAYIGSQTQPPAAPISGAFFGPDSRRFQGLMRR